MIHTIKGLRAIAAGALLALGATAAQAAPVFTVNPNSNGLSTSGTVFQADAMHGNSSAHITYTGNGVDTYTYNGQGYIDYTTFQLNNQAVKVNISRDNFDYGVYATFQQTFACSSFLAPGVSCNVSSITLNLYADPGNDNSYIAATSGTNVGDTGTDATVDMIGNQILLGTVTRVTSGSAGIDAQGGAFQNVNTDFIITPEGQTFFTSPDPFYSFAFSAFNNTSQGLSCNGNNQDVNQGCSGAFTSLAINDESGISDFNVPEPASLTIIGAGLLGLGALRRRKS